MPGSEGRCPFVGPRPGEESPELRSRCTVSSRIDLSEKVCFGISQKKPYRRTLFRPFYKGNWRKPACLSKSIRPMLRDAAFHLIAFPCNVKPTVKTVQEYVPETLSSEHVPEAAHYST